MSKRTPIKPSLFPPTLQHWRQQRGQSQLQLAIAAEVSVRHISFLETGRSSPSRNMVLRLGESLDMAKRDIDVMLESAGFTPEYAGPSETDAMQEPSVRDVLNRMLVGHEPYPMVAMDIAMNVVNVNRAATLMLMEWFPNLLSTQKLPFNFVEMGFDPQLGRPFVLEWQAMARWALTGLQNRAIERPGRRAELRGGERVS